MGSIFKEFKDTVLTHDELMELDGKTMNVIVMMDQADNETVTYTLGLIDKESNRIIFISAEQITEVRHHRSQSTGND